MDELLQKVKDNLILSHDEDDELLAMAASGGPTGRPFRRPPTCFASGPSPEWRFLPSCSCSAKAAGMTLPVWKM